MWQQAHHATGPSSVAGAGQGGTCSVGASTDNWRVAALEDVRRLALTLPRTSEHLIHDRVKFRVKQLVYVAFSRDETMMGFAFPREERADQVGRDDRYLLPGASDLRFNWVVCRIGLLDHDEMEERVCDAWAMCVPKFLVRERLGGV